MKPFSLVFIHSFFVVMLLFSCSKEEVDQDDFDADKSIQYCKNKLSQTIKYFDEKERLPRSIGLGEKHWSGNSINSWTSGFYPGILWRMYELTGEPIWSHHAAYYTSLLEPVRRLPWKTHDFGFMIYYSYGLGYEMTKDPYYKTILLETADSLATMFNPVVGTFESWPWMKRKRGWPHTTIVDNMMNLELLFWASKNGGDPKYRKLAEEHALKTLEDFIRPDNSTFHVVVYDTTGTGFIKKTSDQGYADHSTWARGHSWATYGFVKAFEYTDNDVFLSKAEDLAMFYLDHVEEDLIPYWDFDAPGIPDEPKDASAAAIMSCALLDLGVIAKEEYRRGIFHRSGLEILKELSSERYRASHRDAFLKNSVGSKPASSEVTSSLIYTDYFYLEALSKLKKFELDPEFARHE